MLLIIIIFFNSLDCINRKNPSVICFSYVDDGWHYKLTMSITLYKGMKSLPKKRQKQITIEEMINHDFSQILPNRSNTREPEKIAVNFSAEFAANDKHDWWSFMQKEEGLLFEMISSETFS